MSAMLVALRLVLAGALGGAPALRLAALAALIAAGVAAFSGLAIAFGVTDWRELRGQLTRSRGQPA